MKIAEVINRTQQSIQAQPSLLQQQSRIGKLVKQIAASDQQKLPTEMDKVLAMRRYADVKKQMDKHYAQQLRMQLKQAETFEAK